MVPDCLGTRVQVPGSPATGVLFLGCPGIRGSSSMVSRNKGFSSKVSRNRVFGFRMSWNMGSCSRLFRNRGSHSRVS